MNLRLMWIYIGLVTVLVTFSQAQSCLEVDDNGQCFLCEVGAHVENGLCLYNIDNCISYEDEFKCTGCKDGFELESSSSCTPAEQNVQVSSAGYQSLSNEQIAADSNVNLMDQILKNQLAMIPKTAEIDTVYVKNQNTKKHYRLVYRTENGFAQISSEYDEVSKKLGFQKQQFFERLSNEEEIILDQEPQSEQIKKQIFSRFPDLTDKQLLKGFKRGIQEDLTYRFLFLTSEQGIIEIEVRITESNNLRYVDLSELEKTVEFQKGYSYFVTNYGSQLAGSQVENLAVNSIHGTLYYIIIFKKGDIRYQGMYQIDGDEIKMKQFTTVQSEFLKMPPESDFYDITLDQFQNDADSSRILDFLIQSRNDQLAGSTISTIKFLYSQQHFYYRILFVRGDKMYWKNVALNVNTKRITLVSQSEAIQIQQEATSPNEESGSGLNNDKSEQDDQNIENSNNQIFQNTPNQQPSTQESVNTQNDQNNQKNSDEQENKKEQENSKENQESASSSQGTLTNLNEKPEQTEEQTNGISNQIVTIPQSEYPDDQHLPNIMNLLKRFYSDRLGTSSLIQIRYQNREDGRHYFLTYMDQNGKQQIFHVLSNQNGINVLGIEEREAPTPEIMTLTEAQYEKDEVFRFINGRLLIIYGQKIGTNVRIQKVQKQLINGKIYYIITYSGSNGHYTIDVQSSEDLDFDVKNLREETGLIDEQPKVLKESEYEEKEVKEITNLIELLYGKRMPEGQIRQIIVKKVGNNNEYSVRYEDERNTYVYRIRRSSNGKIDVLSFDVEGKNLQNLPGGPVTLTKEEYENDPNFQAIDQKLRSENDLEGFTPTSVSRQIVNGNLYTIVYRNPEGAEFTYVVLVPFNNGEITVESSSGKAAPVTPPVLPGSPVTLTKEEYENDPNFQAIDQKLRSENDLEGFTPTSVSRQIVNGNLYTIVYRNPEGAEFTYVVLVPFNNGEITVESSSGKAAPVTPPVLPGSPVTLTKEEYENDPNFQAIDQKLRSENDLEGFTPTSVSRHIVNGNLYTIVYRNPEGAEFTYVVLVPFNNGEITVESSSGKAAPVTPPVLPGSPVTLTKEEYENDPNFQAIDQKLRSENDLEGFTPTSVSRQIVNGNLYTIVYRNPEGAEFTYVVLVPFNNGEITVESSSGKAAPVTPPVLPGSPVTLTKEEYENDPNFQAIDQKLRSENDLEGFTPTSVSRQIVNGNLYTIVYRNPEGAEFTYVVLVPFNNGEITVESSSGKAAPVTPPVLPGSPVTLTKEEYENDPNFQAIDQKLRSENDLEGFTPTSVSRQIVNGNLYTIVYRNPEGAEFTYVVLVPFNNGEITVESSSGKAAPVTPPVLPGSPVTLTKEEYENDPNFQAIDQKLRSENDLEGFTPTSVSRQIVNGNLYTIVYRNPEGAEFTYVVLVPFNNGEITVESSSGKAAPVTPPVLPGSPVTLTKEEYENDPNFQAIDQKLRSENDLEGFTPTSVSRQIVNGNLYTIVYRNPEGAEFTYVVLVPFNNGEITVESSSGKAAPVTPPVLPGSPVTLTKEEYENDPNFQAIDQKLRSENDLEGFTPTSVSRQIVNGNLYTIVYRNPEGAEFTYVVLVPFNNGEITVESSSGKAAPVTPPVLPGSPVTLTKEEYENDPNFQAIDQKLRSENDLEGFTPTSVSRQIVNGNLYTIVYRNPEGAEFTYVVLVPFNNGEITVESSSGKAAPVTPPVLPGSPVTLTKEEYENDPNFQAIDQKLRSENDLEGFTPTSVSRQIVNGNLYTIVYRNPEGAEFTYVVLVPFNNGEITVESSSGKAAPVTPPVLPGSPVTLTKEEYENDPNFQAIDQKLRSENDLEGFTPTSVSRQIVNGNLYTIVYRNPEGAEFTYVVLVPFNNGEITVESSSGKAAPVTPPVLPGSPVTLTKEEYENDPNFQAIDQKLRSENDLEGFTPTSVSRQIVNGNLYTIVYRNPEGAEFTYVVLVPFNNGEITVESSSGKAAPVTPPSPILPTNLPQYLFAQLHPQQYVYTPESFSAHFPSQYQTLMKYFLLISDPQSSISYIFFNPATGLYRLYTSKNSWFVLQPLQSGYQVVKISSQSEAPILYSTINLSQANRNRILNFINHFSQDQIASIGGRGQFESNHYFGWYYVFITLNSGQIYVVKLLGTNKLQPDTLLPISYSVFPNANPEYQFIPVTPQPSSAQDQIQQLFSHLNPANIVSVEQEVNQPNIWRVVFENSQGECYEAVISDSKVLSLRRIDWRFLITEGEPDTSDFQPALQLIRDNFQQGEVRLVKSRQLNGYSDFIIIYEAAKETYQIRVIQQNGKYFIESLKPLDTGLYKQQYSYKKFDNAEQANIDEIIQTRAFKISQNHLFKHYGHFLLNPVIKDIFIEQSSEKQSITYHIIYVTRSTTFLAILHFDEATEKPTIKSLVVAEEEELQPDIPNCDEIGSNNRCAECKEGYIEGRDGFCFAEVQNCKHQAGNACYLCEKPFILIDNQCTSDCGILCDGSLYDYVKSLPRQ